MQTLFEFCTNVNKICCYIKECGAPDMSNDDKHYILKLEETLDSDETQCLTKEDQDRVERIMKENEIA